MQSYISNPVSLNSLDVFINLYPEGTGVRKQWLCAAQGSRFRTLKGQKFIFLIFVTLSWTLQVEITTLKDGTYPHVFLPDPFNNISKNSKQQINSKNVFLFIFIIFYIFSQVSHVSAD